MKPPVFSIHLDLPVQERYKELVSSFDIPMISKEIDSLYNSFYLPHDICKLFPPPEHLHLMYSDEIKYWSSLFNIPTHKIILLQLVYEIHSGCTTTVVNGVMYRTMDWPLLFLKLITYHGIFYKEGKKLYEGVCWLGSVGIFTGKNESMSLAINYRRIHTIGIQTFLDNVKRAIQGYYPVSYLLRHVLETNRIELLQDALLISPVYYIVNPFDSTPYILIRNYNSYTRNDSTPLIQTNTDTSSSNPNIMYSHERYALLEKAYSKNENIIKTMKMHPIINEDTIYFCIMSKDGMNIYL